MNRPTRRTFLAQLPAAVAVVGTTAHRIAADEPDAWSFALLGDTHFDRLEHHDLKWLAAEHPGDVAQVRRYSEHAATLLPNLFATVKSQIAAAAKAPVDCVVHVGDLVEGLCGTPELARRHVVAGLEFVADAGWNVPLLLTKGNHDVTGPGAAEVYQREIVPLLGRQVGARIDKPRYAVERRGALFAMFDAYDKNSLAWLKETLGKTRRRTGPTFVVVHQPIVPFQARGNWSVLIRPEQRDERRELLELLGEHRAIVLCGHVHRYGFVVRTTDRGPFAQLAVSSILSSTDQQPKQLLVGLDAYGPDLTELEPSFQPETKAERRALFAAEKPFVQHYEYADAAGHAVLQIAGNHVTANICLGTSAEPWKRIDLTAQLARS